MIDEDHNLPAPHKAATQRSLRSYGAQASKQSMNQLIEHVSARLTHTHTHTCAHSTMHSGSYMFFKNVCTQYAQCVCVRVFQVRGISLLVPPLLVFSSFAQFNSHQLILFYFSCFCCCCCVRLCWYFDYVFARAVLRHTHAHTIRDNSIK